MVVPTVADRQQAWYFSGTAAAVARSTKLVFSRSLVNQSLETAQAFYLFWLGGTMWKSSRVKIFSPNSFGNTIKPNYLPREDFHVVKITVLHKMMQGCWAKWAKTALIFKNACKEYYGCRAVGSAKTNKLLLTVIDTTWRSYVGKNFGPGLFHRGEFHMVLLTDVDDILIFRSPSTVTTVAMVSMARKECHSGRTVDIDV